VDSAQDATVLGGSAGCRAWVPLLKSRPHHVPLSLTGAKDPLLWSGTESDPHVSKPSFRVESMGGIGHVGGCREAPYDTRESGSDGARALQMGGIGHVGGCREAPYDTRESGSDGARALQDLEWLEANGWTVLRTPRSWEAALAAGLGCHF
jgi:hypothetical protein